jgi:peptide/nickel transport system ATP-binding protein
VLVITHDLPSLLRAAVCDDIALMSAGSILRRAATTDMLADPDAYVRRFFGAVTS